MTTVSVSNASAVEGDGEFLAFVVTLSEASLDAISMEYAAVGGTGGSADVNWGFDYNGRTVGTLSFAPGVTSQTIYIDTNTDSLDERDESIILQLSNLTENASFDTGESILRATGVILDNDGAGSNLDLFVSDPILTEGDSGTKEAVFEVRLSQPANQAFSVTYQTRDISAVAGQDYIATSGSLSFAPGEEVKTVRVQVFGDAEAELTESFALVVDAPSSPSLGVAGLVGEAVILDDDRTPGPVISVSHATAIESDGEFLAFVVTLSEPSLDSISMEYAAVGGTGGSADVNWGFDYNGRTVGTLSFAPGVTSQTIYIDTNTDSLDERDESIILQLSNLTENASFDTGESILRATGVILDNDGAGSNLDLFVSDPILTEGDSGTKEAVFEVRLSQPANQAFSVTYQTRDISAVAGQDYIATSGSLGFAPGEEVKTVRVQVYGDAEAELTESFALVVDAPSSPSLGVAGLVGEAVILDDDRTPGPVISVSHATAIESDGEFLAFVVTLSEPSLDSISMEYAAVGGTGGSADVNWGFDYNGRTVGTLSFAPGVTSQTIYIDANTDSLDERDESIILQLSNLTENASFDTGESILRATGVILDNDGAGSNLDLFVSDPILTEGDSGTKEAVFEVRLSQPANQAFSVTYQTRDISAVAGQDYIATSGSLSFAPGEEVKTVRVQVFGDAEAELTESFALVVDAPSSPSLGVAGLVGEAVILDDDTTPGPVISVSHATAIESDGEFLAFVVTLSEPSLTEVTLDYRMMEGSAVSNDLNWGLNYSGRTVGTVSFAPGETSQTIYIDTNTDSLDERDETVFLDLSNARGASFADGAVSVQAVGFILDNDGLGPNRMVSVAPTITREQSTAIATYEIPILLSQVSGDVLTFDVAPLDITARAGVDFRLLDSSVTFLPGETTSSVTVQILGDALDEATETFDLSITPQVGTPFVGTIPNGRVTILNGPRIPTPGNDVLEGTSSPDTINLLAGDDYYNGLGGNDFVRGGAGADTIIGGSGTDTLMGEAGSDFLIGQNTSNLTNSAEGQVLRIYRATLDRAPDTGGLINWSARLESGSHTVLDVVSGFVASPEFRNVYGNLSDGAFVTLLYNNVLDRAPDAGGLSNWSARLANGMSREEVVIGFSESNEFKTKTSLEVSAYSGAMTGRVQAEFADDVFRLYQATLDRAPDQTGLENWSGRLGSGQGYTEIAAGFTNSQEFRQAYGAVDNMRFVELLYQNVLNRAADAGGLAAWSGRLNDGMSRESVVQGFAQSQEFIANTSAPFTAYMKGLAGDVLDGGAGNDTMAGSLGADRFIFNAAEDGRDLVLQVDPWDTLVFESFGYDAASDALAHMSAAGRDVVFSDQGVAIVFAGTTLAKMEAVDYSFVL